MNGQRLTIASSIFTFSMVLYEADSENKTLTAIMQKKEQVVPLLLKKHTLHICKVIVRLSFTKKVSNFSN